MTKYRVSFLLDTETMAPEADGLRDIYELVSSQLLNGAMRTHRDALRALRACGTIVDTDEQRRAIGGMMLALMAQANLSVEEMPADTFVETELPFEKQNAA
jgi:hypothetical protein